MLAEARRAFERAFCVLWRQLVIARGVDITSEQTMRSCIVFAPHPDDETLGCGGLIARKRAAGTRVRVVIASTGARSHGPSADALDLAAVRAREVTGACRILGVEPHELVLLGLPDGELVEHEDELVARIAEEIDLHRPDDVLVTSTRDWHPDHRTLARAVRRAAVRSHSEPRVFEYPIWWWVDGPWRRRATPSRVRYGIAYATDTLTSLSPPPIRIVATRPYRATKRSAVAAHRTQVEPIDPDSTFVALDRRTRAALTGRYEVLIPISNGATCVSRNSAR
jgi:LmbE family N-acetylglucosaminyl deacetylase